MNTFEQTKNTRPIIEGNLKYIRSDVPTCISGKERQWLIDNNILTIVDLREESEQIQKPCPLRDDSEFNYLSMPVTGGNKVPASQDEVAFSYIGMVDDNMDNIVNTIMNADTNVLYFCNAGKDRTGVVTAIILSKLGYEKCYIINDYLLSGDNLRADLQAFARENTDIDINVITPKRKYIEKFLEWYYQQIFVLDTIRHAVHCIDDAAKKALINKAIEACEAWVDNKADVGEILYNYLDNEEESLSVFLEMEEDEVRRHALNCIIYGVAYIARKSYEHEGAKYFPEPIELVDEKTVTDMARSFNLCMKN